MKNLILHTFNLFNLGTTYNLTTKLTVKMLIFMTHCDTRWTIKKFEEKTSGSRKNVNNQVLMLQQSTINSLRMFQTEITRTNSIGAHYTILAE